jgi:calcineurin-like phosphoesterase family protein
MAHWFTADTHFNHHNIISHCKRPFADVEEMNGVLLKNLRSCVKEDDTLWVVGDFAWNRGRIDAANDIFSQIPGKKRLIKGNHDPKAVQSKLPWDSVDDIVELDLHDHHLVMTHYPLLTWNRARYGALNLFGHVHNNWAGSRNSINVGVDLFDFRPVQLPEIIARGKSLPVNPLWDTVEPGAPLA